MKRAFLIHGWEGYPDEGWRPWLKEKLEKKGFKVFVPAMPDTKNPKMNPWVNHLSKIVGKPDENCYFLGHSLGCITILRYLENLKNNQKVGKIDILVNNAGIVFDLAFSERTVEHWKRTLEVNLIGTFLCSKYVISHMKKHGGKIVNVSSNNGLDAPSPESVDYDASKAGIIILTRDLAKILAPEIQVNSVAPGWVDTEMNKNLPKDYLKGETEKISLKRFAKPDEIAKAILFLASDDASYATGSILKIDGGYA